MTMGHLFRKSHRLVAVYFVYSVLFYVVSGEGVSILDTSIPKSSIGKNASLSCTASPVGAQVGWLFQGKPLTLNERIIQTNGTGKQMKSETGEVIEFITLNITITNATYSDAGNYTCVTKMADVEEAKTVTLDLSFPAKNIPQNKTFEFRADDKSDADLRCVFEIYQPTDVKWFKVGNEGYTERNSTRISLKQIESTLHLRKIGTNDNGTYICEIFDSVNGSNVIGQVDVIVYAKPVLNIQSAIGISTTELYFNWTIDTHNCKVGNYNLFHSLPESGQGLVLRTDEKISTNSTAFVVKNLIKSTEYSLKLEVMMHGKNNVCNYTDSSVKTGWTLDKDPMFIPNISINGFSATSVTIGWAAPPEDIAHLVHYYLLEARKKEGGATATAFHSQDARNLPYMFEKLEPHSTYIFKARACQLFTTQKCFNWSEEMEAATLDGFPGKPDEVQVNCSATQMVLTWLPPRKPNAEIKGYMIELTGFATYRDRSGALKNVTWGPLSKFMTNDTKMVRFDDLQPNTNYTARVFAMTRSRRHGDDDSRHCQTWKTPPDHPPRPRWRKIMESDSRYMFKMYMPKISERNGPICCYRIYMVKMLPNTDLKDLKSQKQLDVISYEEAHSGQPTLGAYITDVFTNNIYPSDGETLLGDGRSLFNRSDPALLPPCNRCLRRPPRTIVVTTSTTTSTTTTTEDDGLTTEASEGKRERRSLGGDYASDPMMSDKTTTEDRDMIEVKDGPLDSTANYTLFVELISGIPDAESQYSDYVNLLRPAPAPPAPPAALERALQVTCAIAAIVLLGMIVFCVLQTRRSRKLPPHAHLEMNPIQAALRYVVGHMGGRAPTTSVPPALPPIPKAELAAAYQERHADCDYGFQKEFELLQLLSESIPDRTTHASEARENQPKNRYPDIKAYDQTRVKLSQIDGITGSDYINANYVMGYKERKKFICAQGPTDTTVNDFWRMIWEHGLELIVMLTNLEEYSKVKCSKYWPDEVRGSRAFGAVTVTHVSEKRYSDYIVRELKISKLPTNSEGQPIVENNGVAKRNGDIKEPPTDSTPTSPRSPNPRGAAGGGGTAPQGGTGCTEARTVRQYHFLMWKDFAAPEHPQSILKFIKRVNEAWSHMVGRPAVVHCSAGVGRTGTLVALDCLLEQLEHTGHAAVFNTVAELRRQRNFLVQSQKQYVFVYRALVEAAHYGDTELPASGLRAAVDRLRNTPEGAGKCLMEDEFEKMISSAVPELAKPSAAAQTEEARARNRSLDALPYDCNRVMLPPMPNREHSTYINASFIEGYDNTEGYIITQDPMPNTIFDFWRMVCEESVTTIVMLSELGEGKCPRYWDDGCAQYEHISVQYVDSESCPYYTRRQFRVTNNKSGHSQTVNHLQYQGWPTARGHVPEVTRGLAELADAAGDNAPMLVHCHLGTERSALFVSLCILIAALRTERRVDVCAAARRVRAQRGGTIDTFLQYEFLHRAILNYAELHNLLEDS